MSLKAFAAGFKLSANNHHSPLAVLEQGRERRYKSDSVSWKNEGGSFFIGRIDRTKLEAFNRQEEERQRKEADA